MQTNKHEKRIAILKSSGARIPLTMAEYRGGKPSSAKASQVTGKSKISATHD